MFFRSTFIRAEKRVHILTCFHLLLKKAVKYKKEALEIGTYTIQRFREAVLHVGKYCIEESTLRGNLPACAEVHTQVGSSTRAVEESACVRGSAGNA